MARAASKQLNSPKLLAASVEQIPPWEIQKKNSSNAGVCRTLHTGGIVRVARKIANFTSSSWCSSIPDVQPLKTAKAGNLLTTWGNQALHRPLAQCHWLTSAPCPYHRSMSSRGSWHWWPMDCRSAWKTSQLAILRHPRKSSVPTFCGGP